MITHSTDFYGIDSLLTMPSMKRSPAGGRFWMLRLQRSLTTPGSVASSRCICSPSAEYAATIPRLLTVQELASHLLVPDRCQAHHMLHTDTFPSVRGN